MELAVAIYEATDSFPLGEQHGMASQMRRAAISIPSNIAEGSKRSTQKDFRNFLIIALGSGAELETQIELAKRVGLCADQKFSDADSMLAEYMRMLQGTINKNTKN